MSDLSDFERFLHKKEKSNGDKLLPKTIEEYLYFIKPYKETIDSLKHDEERLSEKVNSIITSRPSVVIRAAIRNYLEYLGFTGEDYVVRKLVKPKKHRSSMTSKRYFQGKVLSRGELKRLMNEADEETRLIISMLYDTGCRKSELLNIKWGDIEFVKEPKGPIHAKVNIIGKGAKAREVYLKKTSVDLLKKLKGDLKKDEKVIVLRKMNGKPYGDQGVQLYKIINGLGNKVLGRDIAVHDLRHTCGSHMANRGADGLGISRYLGHESVDFTEKTYISHSPAIGRSTYQKFSEDILEEDAL